MTARQKVTPTTGVAGQDNSCLAEFLLEKCKRYALMEEYGYSVAVGKE